MEWIDINDKLPEDGTTVLIFVRTAYHVSGYLAYRHDEQWLSYDFNSEPEEIVCVTHWCPLPDAPNKSIKQSKERERHWV